MAIKISLRAPMDFRERGDQANPITVFEQIVTVQVGAPNIVSSAN
jgi:hypothetical protein